jgi:hypothetical protein
MRIPGESVHHSGRNPASLIWKDGGDVVCYFAIVKFDINDVIEKEDGLIY